MFSSVFAGSTPHPLGVDTAPSGSCSGNQSFVVTEGSDKGKLYSCVSGTWARINFFPDSDIVNDYGDQDVSEKWNFSAGLNVGGTNIDLQSDGDVIAKSFTVDGTGYRLNIGDGTTDGYHGIYWNALSNDIGLTYNSPTDTLLLWSETGLTVFDVDIAGNAATASTAGGLSADALSSLTSISGAIKTNDESTGVYLLIADSVPTNREIPFADAVVPGVPPTPGNGTVGFDEDFTYLSSSQTLRAPNAVLTGNLQAATLTGALTGNASTATALAANPTDCSSNQFANAIAADGDLACAALVDADVPDDLTISTSSAITTSDGGFESTVTGSGPGLRFDTASGLTGNMVEFEANGSDRWVLTNDGHLVEGSSAMRIGLCGYSGCLTPYSEQYYGKFVVVNTKDETTSVVGSTFEVSDRAPNTSFNNEGATGFNARAVFAPNASDSWRYYARGARFTGEAQLGNYDELDLVSVAGGMFLGSTYGNDITPTLGRDIDEVNAARFVVEMLANDVDYQRAAALHVEDGYMPTSLDNVSLPMFAGIYVEDLTSGAGDHPANIATDSAAVLIAAQSGSDAGKGSIVHQGGGIFSGHLVLGDWHLWFDDDDAHDPLLALDSEPSADSDGMQVVTIQNDDAVGLVAWGDPSDANFDTGDEVCDAHKMECLGTRSWESLPSGSEDNCTKDWGTELFIARCAHALSQ